MILEVIAAAALGALLVWLAFGRPGPDPAAVTDPDLDPVEETPRGRALLAIKELEFDRETGKIAEDDYQDLRKRLAAEAVHALDADTPAAAAAVAAVGPSETGPIRCPGCGPRPERDALFCSSCGAEIGGRPGPACVS